MEKNNRVGYTRPYSFNLSLAMKLTTILLILSIFTVQANSYAQKAKVTLDLRQVKMYKVFEEIESLTDFKFLYDNTKIDTAELVSIKASNMPVSEVLNILFKNTSIYYVVRKKQIVLKSQKATLPAPIKEESEVIEEEKFVQNIISGTITDDIGQPLPGANVVEKGTTNGVTADFDGNFSITLTNESPILIISYVGFSTKEILVSGLTNLEIILQEDAAGLEEVVVVGYGTQKKATLTGAVVAVKGEELEKIPTNNLSNTLVGRTPGVIGLNRSGQPGDNGSQLFIRGTSTLGVNGPLFVIDGVPGREGFDQIDPRDIQSISVLKDASAAIYGARAANGVILVTTKRGAIGKPQVSFTYNQGIVEPTRLPDYANSAALAEFQNEQLSLSGQPLKFTPEEIEKFRNQSDPINYPDTDWIESTMKDFSIQSRQSLSIRGGSDFVKYYLASNFSTEEGMFKNGITNSKSFGVRSNIDVNLTDNIKLSLDLSFQEKNNHYPAKEFEYIVQQTYRNYPYLIDYYPNGLPGPGYIENQNPRVMVTGDQGYRDGTYNLYQTKFNYDIKIPAVQGLGVDGFISYDKNQNTTKVFEKPSYVYQFDSNTDEYTKLLAGQITSPQLSQGYEFDSPFIINARLKYERSFGNHNINTFAAYEQGKYKSNYFSAFRQDFVSPEIDELFAGGGANQRTDGGAAEYTRRNYFGRASYQFKERYLVDVNLRYDGSSVFPKDNRWGFFPGISAGWRLSEEPFFKNSVDFVSNLKLRGSWGKMGNDAILPFQYLALYSFTPGYIFGESNQLNTGLTQGVEANPYITWEVAKTTNLGFDMGLWDNSFSLTFELFKSVRSNILTQRNASIPVYTGLRLPLENIGEVENKGFELSLNYNSSNGENSLNYYIGGNVSYADNTVLNIDEPATVVDWQRSTGRSMNTGLYYDAIGIYREQSEIDNSPHPSGTIVGDLQYRDVDNNGEIDANDRIRPNKTNIPEYTYGVNFGLQYKNWSLDALLQGQAGVWGYYYIPQGLFGNVLSEMLENRPTPNNPNSKYPNLTYDESQVSAFVSDYWLMNSSFLRLKSMEIAYDFPSDIVNKIGLDGFKLYINGFNLLTFDNLKIFDPEGDADRASFYPQNKVYNLGINITF
ncbi:MULTISPECIES: TonB-dependent receptor [unclassified Arenibacter]|uniref:TonB-dependent receptor n=1 Tax=unclassified Arenibacter TaxID=2615047 RepID=UPI000E3405CE|nr:MULTISPECIES: TonB-dependent receptor [unclassified Arenibacter]MCM4162662.1 SusC/RagA family TonB-linked outer membrane protein [Arenibacter sp. A80]RFT58227.1 SusC/RagA family TonB-linked outer membrane protein [Arenibacter sp. P308M17]